MKTNDLLMIGGIGLLAYMLVSKPTEAKDAGGVTVIPMKDTSQLELGGIFSGIASLLGAIPSQIVPEINIPEFTFPDPTTYIPEVPDWSKYIPDWEMLIPKIPDEGLIPDIPSLIPDIFPKNGNGLPSWNIPNLIEKAVTGLVSAKETTIFSEQWWTDIMPSFALTEWGQYKREHEAEWEAEWEAKGLPETITPEWYYEQKRLTSGLLPQDIAVMRKETEVEAAEKYPGYAADIELLKKHPYFSTVL